jgi:hypothetical protein
MSTPTGITPHVEPKSPAPPRDYREYLKAELGEVIDALLLDPLQRRFLRSRWLDQIVWMEGRADQSRRAYHALRLAVIVGGVLIPGLVSVGIGNPLGASVVRWATFGLSLTVAICAAVEEFFHHGERWRHYRRTVELLKIEGWQYFSLAGPYRRYKTHDDGFATFAARVEGVIQPSVEVYITDVAREKEAAPSAGDGGAQPTAAVSPERARTAGTPADSL